MKDSVTIPASDRPARSARQRTSTKHGETIWISAEVNFGGVIVTGVLARAGCVVWPHAVAFDADDMQLKAERAVLSLLEREGAARRVEPGRVAE